MKKVIPILLLLLLANGFLLGQDSLGVQNKTHLLLNIGLRKATIRPAVFNFRIGLEHRRNSFLVGVHRNINFEIGRSQLFADNLLVPNNIGIDIVYRYELHPISSKISMFFFSNLFFSTNKVVEDPNYHSDPQELGTWVYFEPNIGYGTKIKLGELMSLNLEAGTGLIIYHYFAKSKSLEGWYWPSQFSGAILLEKRF